MLYTVKEVSEIIKTNPSYVYKLIKTGRLCNKGTYYERYRRFFWTLDKMKD